MREVALRDAKAKLSALVDAAESGEFTVITRHGKPAAIVVSVAEWERHDRRKSFARHLMSIPLREGDEALFERDRSPARDGDF